MRELYSDALLGIAHHRLWLNTPGRITQLLSLNLNVYFCLSLQVSCNQPLCRLLCADHTNVLLCNLSTPPSSNILSTCTRLIS